MPKIVINTRPIERAAALSDHLQAAGVTVVEIPMLALQPRPTTDDDRALMRAWLTGEYKALVVISPTAAAAGLVAWESLAYEGRVDDINEQAGRKQKKHENAKTASKTLIVPSPIVAVGQATAAVLNQAKIDTTHHHVRQPTVANNEGMLINVIDPPLIRKRFPSY